MTDTDKALTDAFAILNQRISELENGSFISNISPDNFHFNMFTKIEEVINHYPHESIIYLTKALTRLTIALDDLRIDSDCLEKHELLNHGVWNDFQNMQEIEVPQYLIRIEGLINSLNSSIPTYLSTNNTKLVENTKAFIWTGSEKNKKETELKLLFEILQDKVIDTNFETFKKAFSGKVITSPLNIKWKKKPEKNKRTSDYSSIFNFLQALINEGKIDIILNLHTEGSKVGDGLYTQVGNIFCHEDENSFFSDKNETNQNLKNLKKSAKQYLDKTTDFQNIIKSLG
jgi:hypothetical protein